MLLLRVGEWPELRNKAGFFPSQVLVSEGGQDFAQNGSVKRLFSRFFGAFYRNLNEEWRSWARDLAEAT